MDLHSGICRGKPSRGEKSAVDRLESEAAAMEHRLVSLRKQLESDRKKRESANMDRPTNAGSFWANGQTGFVSTHAQQLVKEMKSNPRKSRKFKFLTESPNVDTKNIPHPPKCEKSQISHSIPISNATMDTGSYQKNAGKHSLLDGCYDEKQNANSFREALSDWRNAKSETETETMTSATETIQHRKPMELPAFQPNQNLTYFDRLILRKYKSESVNSFVQKVPSTETQDSVLRRSVSEYNIFYSPDSIIGESNDTKNTEELEITEINDSDEDDMNEINNFEDRNELKIVTQTNLSDFFLLGTAKPNENTKEISHGVAGNWKIDKPIISTLKQGWKPSESVSIISRKSKNREESSDSDSDPPIEDGQNDAIISEDEDILTLESLSQELKSGSHPDTILWSDLMNHRPPTTSDFN